MNVLVRAHVLALMCFQVHAAVAQAPVAILEEVKGKVPGLEAMDYLVPGRTFHVPHGGAVIIGYLNSCVHETIHGGSVVIGNEQSTVENGFVERAKVECDAQDMMGTSGQALDSTGYVLRGFAKPPKEELPAVPQAPEPQFTLYGSAPLIELNGAGILVIARLDAKGEYLKFDLDRARLMHGRFSILRPPASRSARGASMRLAGRSVWSCSGSIPRRTPVRPRSWADF